MIAGMTIFLGWLAGVPEILPRQLAVPERKEYILDLNPFSVAHIPINVGCSRHGLYVSFEVLPRLE